MKTSVVSIKTDRPEMATIEMTNAISHSLAMMDLRPVTVGDHEIHFNVEDAHATVYIDINDGKAIVHAHLISRRTPGYVAEYERLLAHLRGVERRHGYGVILQEAGIKLAAAYGHIKVTLTPSLGYSENVPMDLALQMRARAQLYAEHMPKK